MILPSSHHLYKSLSSATVQIARRNLQVAAAAASSPATTTLSFASPESDFCATPRLQHYSTLLPRQQGPAWSESLSFTSPDSDFNRGAAPRSHYSTLHNKAASAAWSESLSFASPKADFVATASTKEYSVAATQQDSEWSHTMSFASPEADWCNSTVMASEKPITASSLPRTLQQVLSQDTDQALVVTTAQAPHVIVHVNAAWETLCGYSKAEAVHGSLKLIQGPESDNATAEQLVQRVVETRRAADTILTNYSKSGRAFINHLTVAPLRLKQDDTENKDEVQFLVGLLQEIPGAGNASQRRVSA